MKIEDDLRALLPLMLLTIIVIFAVGASLVCEKPEVPPAPMWFGSTESEPIDTVITFATIDYDSMRVRMVRALRDGELPDNYRYGFAFYGGRSLPTGVYHAYHYGDSVPSWWGYKLPDYNWLIMWWMSGQEHRTGQEYVGVRRTYMWETVDGDTIPLNVGPPKVIGGVFEGTVTIINWSESE